MGLVDEHITRTLAHKFTLSIGDKRVFSPDLAIFKSRRSNNIGENSGTRDTRGTTTTEHIINNQKIGPILEESLDDDIVVGESSSRETKTSITSEEERKREVEDSFRESSSRLDEVGVISNHIDGITVTLAFRDGESGPHIEERVVEDLGGETSELDGDFTDQVVHEVAGPADEVLVTSGRRESTSDGGQFNTEPHTEKNITRAVNSAVEFTTELTRTSVAENTRSN